MSRPCSSVSTTSSSSASTPANTDCLFCCAFNAFLAQHRCYHKFGASTTKSTQSNIELTSHYFKSGSKRPLTTQSSSWSNFNRQRLTPSPTPNQKWFIQNDVSRDEVASMLKERPVGAFFIRPSKTCGSGVYVLSVRVPHFVNGAGIAHYLIVKNAASGRYRFQTSPPTLSDATNKQTSKQQQLKQRPSAAANSNSNKEWKDLESLVIHHTIMREFLPCTLQMPEQYEGADDVDNNEYYANNDTKEPRLHSQIRNYSASTLPESLPFHQHHQHSRQTSTASQRSQDHEVLDEFLKSFRHYPTCTSQSSLINSRPTICC